MHGKPWNAIVNDVPMSVAAFVLPMLRGCLQPDPTQRPSALQLLKYIRSVENSSALNKYVFRSLIFVSVVTPFYDDDDGGLHAHTGCAAFVGCPRPLCLLIEKSMRVQRLSSPLL